jgi:hypothetical protein
LKCIICILLVVSGLQLSAHEFYFSFAEMQYNAQSKRYEVSIRATGHDVEDFLKSKGEDLPSLEGCIGNPIAENVLERFITQYFKVLVHDKALNFTLIGLEVNIKDEVIFYLKSNALEKPDAIEVTYDLLMDYFPDQQNKLTLFTEKGKAYLGFLPSRRTRIYEYE